MHGKKSQHSGPESEFFNTMGGFQTFAASVIQQIGNAGRRH